MPTSTTSPVASNISIGHTGSQRELFADPAKLPSGPLLRHVLQFAEHANARKGKATIALAQRYLHTEVLAGRMDAKAPSPRTFVRWVKAVVTPAVPT